jgi:hypothetical protein
MSRKILANLNQNRANGGIGRVFLLTSRAQSIRAAALANPDTAALCETVKCFPCLDVSGATWWILAVLPPRGCIRGTNILAKRPSDVSFYRARPPHHAEHFLHWIPFLSCWINAPRLPPVDDCRLTPGCSGAYLNTFAKQDGRFSCLDLCSFTKAMCALAHSLMAWSHQIFSTQKDQESPPARNDRFYF